MCGDQEQEACLRIVESCDKLDFPLFSTREKKLQILDQERARVDGLFDKILPKESAASPQWLQKRQDFWTQAVDKARKEFCNLDEKHLLNGFYLQEILHRYAELQMESILSKGRE